MRRYDLDKDNKVSFEEILKADEGLRKEEEESDEEDPVRVYGASVVSA